MLRVMLVDDNKSVLEGLSYLINWENYGYTIVSAFRNGRAALDEIEKTDIDVVITDIRMPQMTGLELITEMRRKKPDLKFILISGYSEFDYAKWAIDNQINAYLLKPIDENELIDTLANIHRQITEEREHQVRQRNDYLRNILMGKTEFIDELSLGNTFIRYCMACPYENELIVSNFERYNSEHSAQLYKEISALLDNDNDIYTLKNDFGETEIVIGCNDEINKRLKYINSALREKCDFEIIFFVGKETSVDEIKDSKLSVEMLEDSVFYNEKKSFFIYDDYKNEEYFEFLPDTAVIDSLIYSIKNGTEEDVQKAVDRFCEEVKLHRIKIASVLRYINNMFFEVCNTIAECGDDSIKYLYRYSLIEKEKYLRFSKLRSFLAENALDFRKIFMLRREKSIFGSMSYVIDYINDNYSNEDLNLQFLAQKYHITASYLGKLFKQKTKMSFNNYLMNIRIEKAKELLKNSDDKIYEIAYAVGFSDPNYFTVKFMSVENTTPAKYREQQNKSQENE